MREVRIHSVFSLMMSDEEGNDVELEGEGWGGLDISATEGKLQPLKVRELNLHNYCSGLPYPPSVASYMAFTPALPRYYSKIRTLLSKSYNPFVFQGKKLGEREKKKLFYIWD